jgi:hypothetical protein
MKKISRYHKFLRTTMVVTALVLLFDGGFVSPVSKYFSDVTIVYLANVGSGVFASVEPNEYNELAAQLAEQKRVLDAREASIVEREIPNRFFGGESSVDYSTYILSIILFLQTVLIVANYVLDYVHLRHTRYGQIFG